MKRIIVVTVALAFVLLSAGAALAGIANSKHDMRTHMNVTGGYDEVCVYCHTPHSSLAVAQLWNHSAAPSVFSVYTSSTLNATVGQPGPGSLLCLGCHDGTVAVDAMFNLPNTAGTAADNATAVLDVNKKIVSQANFGTDLKNDHPVGFDYQTAISGGDTGLNTYAFVNAATNSVRLINGTNVECASCHDAHNTVTMPFLRSTNQGSQLCLVCHNK